MTNDKTISKNEFIKIMKVRLKEQGIIDTVLALAWNVVEVKAELKRQLELKDETR